MSHKRKHAGDDGDADIGTDSARERVDDTWNAPSRQVPLPQSFGARIRIQDFKESKDWVREPVRSTLDSRNDSLSFQWTDMDQYEKAPEFIERSHGDHANRVQVFRLYGITDGDRDAHSICVHVHGFKPYLYCQVPEHALDSKGEWKQGLEEHFRDELEAAMNTVTPLDWNASEYEREREEAELESYVSGESKGDAKGGETKRRPDTDVSDPDTIDETADWRRRGRKRMRVDGRVLSVVIERKTNMYGYQPPEKRNIPYFKITLALSGHVKVARKALMTGFTVAGRHASMRTFESNVLFTLRYLADKDIKGACWLTLPAGKYEFALRPTGTSQIEAHIWHEDLVVQPPDGEWAKVATRRELSFDIECIAPHGHFPKADNSPIAMIANVLRVVSGATGARRHRCVIFAFGGEYDPVQEPEPDWPVVLYSFETEARMIEAWAAFLVACDPDIIFGYNQVNFDLPFILNRAEALGILDRVSALSRLSKKKCTVKEVTKTSRAFGTQKDKQVRMPGRIMLDPLTIIRKEHKLRSYTLNNVCAHFLQGMLKDDVHHSTIATLFYGTSKTRSRLAKYCLKDAVLPFKLDDKLLFVVNLIEMARVTGVWLDALLTMGQQIKSLSLILRKTARRGMVVPHIKSTGEKYRGAIVVKVKPEHKRYYNRPISTLDFEALYPNTMRAFNICYSSYLINLADRRRLRAGIDYRIVPADPDDPKPDDQRAAFVRPDLMPGLLPEIETDLLNARKYAKKLKSEAKTPQMKEVFEGRQLAFKLCANSLYGFTAAQKLECRPVASSVTGWGRYCITRTTRNVETHFTKANGYKNDAQVVYGDTDSVMIDWGEGVTRVEADRWAEEAATRNDKDPELPSPLHIVNEKTFQPYILWGPKRYAGLLFKPGKMDKFEELMTKGMETVRRDASPLLAQTMTRCLDMMMIETDAPGAVAYAKRTIQRLLCREIDVSQLVMSVSLSKPKYGKNMLQFKLPEKMAKADPGTRPRTGDRIAFVICEEFEGKKKGSIEATKRADMAENPITAITQEKPINVRWYLDHQLREPLMRLFTPILGEDKVHTLFEGEHMRSVVKAAPSASGPMAKFFKPKASCLGCRVEIKSGAVCTRCEPRKTELYLKWQSRFHKLEKTVTDCWHMCHTCVNAEDKFNLQSSTVDTCANNDCPIFYRRLVALRDYQKELIKAKDLDW